MKPVSPFWDLVHYLQVIRGRFSTVLFLPTCLLVLSLISDIPLYIRYHQIVPF